MSHQNTFPDIPKYSKTYLYSKPTNIYHYYANAFAYAEMVTTQTWRPAKQRVLSEANRAWTAIKSQDRNKIYDEINALLNTPVTGPPLPLSDLMNTPNDPTIIASATVNPSLQTTDRLTSTSPTGQLLNPSPIPTSKNAAAQKQALQDIEDAKRKAEEYKQIVSMTTDEGLTKELYTKIQQAEATIVENQKRLKRLKSGAEAQERFRQKRKKRNEEVVVNSAASSSIEPFEQQRFLIEPAESSDSSFAAVVEPAIEDISEELRDISLQIHTHTFNEKLAHDTLITYLENKGFKVTPRAYGLETAFHAEFSLPEAKGRTIAFNSEYGALSGIGHGCGHNLIAIAGVAAAIGVMTAIRACNLSGKVVLFGTPTQEHPGSKIKMIQAGAYKKVDACMMVHPAFADYLYGGYMARAGVTVEYFGKNAHISAPWDSSNALDAVVLAYNAISMLRQQTHPENRITGIITNGGKTVNATPDHTSAQFLIQSPSRSQLIQLRQKINACFDSAAAASGCTAKTTWEPELYDVLINERLAERFGKYMTERGVHYFTKQEDLSYNKAPTEMGNVSYEVPSVHSMYNIGTTHAVHTPGFAEQAKSETAHEATLRAAKCLALTALDVFVDDHLYKESLREFKSTLQLNK